MRKEDLEVYGSVIKQEEEGLNKNLDLLSSLYKKRAFGDDLYMIEKSISFYESEVSKSYNSLERVILMMDQIKKGFV